MKKTAEATITKIIFVCLILLVAVELYFSVRRCFLGVELTDEAYYISQAELLLQGRLPISDIWTFQSGSLIFYAWLIGIYKVLVPSMEGIFLFTRLSFWCVTVLILCYGFYVIRKKFGSIPALCACSVLLAYNSSEIANFSYNSVALYAMLLAGFIAWDAICGDGEGKYQWVIVGILAAIAVLSHPCQVLNVLLFLLVAVCFEKNKLRACCCYAAGGIGTALPAFLWIILRGGVEKFVDSLNYLRNTPSQIIEYTEDTPYELLMEFLELHFDSLQLFVVSAFSVALALSILYMVWKGKMNRNVLQRILQGSLAAGIFLWVFYITDHSGEQADPERMVFWYFGATAVIASVCMAVFGGTDPTVVVSFLTLSCPAVFFFAMTGYVTNSGYITRLYLAIPAIVGFMIMLVRFLSQNRINRVLQYALLIAVYLLTSVTLMSTNYSFVYREAETSQLTHRVESGIYKGLYTTPLNAGALPHIEQTVRQMTEDCQYVLALDCAPSVYLMTDADSLAPTTWDNMHFNDKKNDPDIMFRYFEFTDLEPDAIVYLSNPHKPRLSIDDAAFLFNPYVTSNYELAWQDQYGESYTLKIYMRK